MTTPETNPPIPDVENAKLPSQLRLEAFKREEARLLSFQRLLHALLPADGKEAFFTEVAVVERVETPTDLLQKVEFYLMNPRMLPEELKEAQAALLDRNFEDVIDGLNDIIYEAEAALYLLFRALGYSVQESVDLRRQSYDRVATANLNKFPFDTDEQGKIVKPAGWEKPRFRDMVVGAPNYHNLA